MPLADHWPSLVGVGVGLLGLATGVWTPFENLSLDLRFALRGARPAEDPPLLVAIDDRAVAQFGRLPWPRSRYADLLTHLDRAAVVGIDVLMSEPASEDETLVQAVAAHGRVVFASALSPDGSRLGPVAALKAVSATGDIGIEYDADGRVRRARLVAPDGEAALATVLARLWASLMGEPPPPATSRPLINWLGPAAALPQVSALDVLEGRVDPERFADRVVLIGATATAVDPLTTPFDRQTSGVALHATVVENLLRGTELRTPPLWFSVAALVALGCAPGLVCEPGRLRAALHLGAGALWSAGAGIAVGAHLALPVAAPAATALLAGGLALVEGERRTARRLLVQSERRAAQQAISDSLVTALIAADSDDRITFANPASAPLREVYPRATLGELFVALGWYEATAWAELRNRIREEGAVHEQRAGFGERTLRLRLLPLVQVGEPTGVLALVDDITAQVEAERLREQMLGMLSHDIRSPLTSIRGFAELLRASPPETEGELEELVSPILTSADRVQGLLTDFLALSRIESPAFTLHPEALPVAEHLHRVVAALLPQIRQRSVRLLEDYPPGELFVWADPLRFEQVFTNLITNALKYGPDGQTVTVCAEATPPWVRIRIADCGFGIPEAALDRIFESFFRVRRPETEGIPGTGLGLAITERLVTLHGGRILVESRLGVGSTFTVEWPADAAHVPG